MAISARGHFRNGPARYRLVIYTIRAVVASVHIHVDVGYGSGCERRVCVWTPKTEMCAACGRSLIRCGGVVSANTLSNTPRRVVKISNDIEYIIYLL